MLNCHAPALQPVTVGRLSTHIIATTGADCTVRLWCSSTGKQLQVLGGHKDRATCMQWSECGSFLASGSLDGTARLWGVQAASDGIGCPPDLSLIPT